MFHCRLDPKDKEEYLAPSWIGPDREGGPGTSNSSITTFSVEIWQEASEERPGLVGYDVTPVADNVTTIQLILKIHMLCYALLCQTVGR